MYGFINFERLSQDIIKSAKCIHQRSLGVNILTFADTHYELTKRDSIEKIYYQYSDPDIIILLGDHHPYFIDLILQYYPAEDIVCVLGNHDKKSLYRDFGLKELHADIMEIKGITIAGISGSHKYKCGDSYFLLSQEESIRVCDKLLQKPIADILISHDKAFTQDIYDSAHCGLIGIAKYVFSKSTNGPVAHIHGHLHRSYKTYYSNNCKELSVYGVEYLSL